MSNENKVKCNDCGKLIRFAKSYTMEAPRFLDMQFCGKCAGKWFRKVRSEL